MRRIQNIVFLLMVGILVVGQSCVPSSKQVVKIAFIGPLSGPSQAIGIGARNSFELRVNEVLASGDYPYQVEVVVLDDESDVQKGIETAQQACADDQIAAAAAHWNSPVGLATVSVFHDCGLMQVLWGTVHRDIIYGNDYQTKVRLLPTSVQFNEMGAEWAVGEFKRLRWVIVYDETELGTTLVKEFAQAIEWRGGTILGQFSTAIGQEDYSQVLKKAASLQPEGIYFGGLVTEGSILRRQMVAMGMGEVMFLGPAGIQSKTFGEIAGEAAEGAFCAGTIDTTQTPDGRKFIEAYQALYTEPFEQNGPYAYDAAGIILEALKAVGPDRQAMIEYIRSHDFAGIIGTIHWDSYGQNTSGGMSLYINQDGEWIRYQDSEYARGIRQLPWEE